MSELRYDPLSGHWVNIAAIRAQRPNEFRHVESRRLDAICPFCAGQESQTPPSILELNASNDQSKPWLVRVVPNKYPAFSPDSKLVREPVGPYTRVAGGGLQEIIIESPRHVTSMSQLTDAELKLSFRAIQLRIQTALENHHIRQVVVFKNCRSEAGASIEHAHSQLVGSPILSEPLAARWQRCVDTYRETGRSLLDSIVQFESKVGLRQIKTCGKFTAFCPYASRFAFQIWIASRSVGGPFEKLELGDLDDVGRLVRSMIDRLERTIDEPPYNCVLHLPPKLAPESSTQEMFPWFIEIIPRLGRWAGFELADGGWINDCPPEYAAQKLRGD